MIVSFRRLLTLGAALLLCHSGQPGRAESTQDFNYLIGRGIEDITGPAVGMPMFGFVRADQITEGIHLRQWARTFVIADPATGSRVALVTADLGSVTQDIQRSVVERLAKEFGDLYRMDNVLIAATHTHAGVGGFWHYGADTPIGSPLYGEFFEAIVDGVTKSIIAAHHDLEPGKILIATGEVRGAGANRSLPAYMNNPEAERKRYSDNMDKQMTLLKFVDKSGEIGSLNWFAVHPTSMTFFNRLISGDNKGYAEYAVEKKRGSHRKNGEYVAAFAQTNCGDITPNLNLDNTGPGKDDFESTQIIGQRQADKALELLATASEPLMGPIDTRHSYVDFSSLVVRDEFTHAGEKRTCASAYGYSFAAGSTEDGGGHPLFREGMTEQVPLIDSILRVGSPIPGPTDQARNCHRPKVILLATGYTEPPSYPQVQALGLIRIGQLTILVGTHEFTTMTGRRLRETVGSVLGPSAKHLVLAGYSNGFGGYLTTFEEYQTQQYEGGHTLFGPWSEAGYRQEYARLAQDMGMGRASDPGPTPPDIRDSVRSTPVALEYDEEPMGSSFGSIIRDTKESYAKGEQAELVVWSGNPRNDFKTGNNYLSVEHREGDQWVPITNDADWETKIRWLQASPDGKLPTQEKPKTASLFPSRAKPSLAAHQAVLTWDIPADLPAGEYRIVHYGVYKPKGESVRNFTAASRTFAVQ